MAESSLVCMTRDWSRADGIGATLLATDYRFIEGGRAGLDKSHQNCNSLALCLKQRCNQEKCFRCSVTAMAVCDSHDVLATLKVIFVRMSNVDQSKVCISELPLNASFAANVPRQRQPCL